MPTSEHGLLELKARALSIGKLELACYHELHSCILAGLADAACHDCIPAWCRLPQFSSWILLLSANGRVQDIPCRYTDGMACRIMNTVGGTASDNAATAPNGTLDGEPETVHVQAKNGEVITAELPHNPTSKSGAEQKSAPEFDVEAQTPRADRADLQAQQAAGNMPLSSATQSLNRSDRSLSPRGNQR